MMCNITCWAAEVRNPLRREMAIYGQATTPTRFARIANVIGRTNAAEFLGAGLIGVARGTIAGAFWQPDEGGQNLAVLAVEDGRCASDIVAFDIRRPDTWALRAGNGSILGFDLIHETNERNSWFNEPNPVLIVATPLEWLAAGGRAICVIDDYSWQALNALRDVAHLEPNSPAFARFLSDKLSRATRVPQVSVGYRELSRAA